MKEQIPGKVNVLGVNVCDMRPEKAVALSLEKMRSPGFQVVYFLTAGSSLMCEESPQAMDLLNSLSLVFPGDRNTEMAVTKKPLPEDSDLDSFTDKYMRRLFARLHREYRELFVVTSTEERMNTLMDYTGSYYPNIKLDGMVFHREEEGAAFKVVNEINAHIPDVLLFLMPARDQLMFLRDYQPMMNAGLCICIESLRSFITDKNRNAPDLIRFLHLESLYYWLRRKNKIESKITESVFRMRVHEDNDSESEHD